MSQASCRVLAVLSAAGLLASVGAWAASYWNIVWHCGVGDGQSQTTLVLSLGGLVAERTYAEGAVLFVESPTGVQVFGFRGFRTLWTPQYRHTERALPKATMHAIELVLPLYIPALAFVAASAALWWRGRRPLAGHCEKCKYDLTGNTSGVCPECGCATGPKKGLLDESVNALRHKLITV